MKLIALDLHMDNIVSAVMDCSQNAPTIQIKKYGLDELSLGEFKASLAKTDIVVVESTSNAFWLYRELQSFVHSCYILDTNAVHLRGNKTDKIDAKKLLQLLSTFVMTNTLEQMPTVYVPSEGVIKLRSLFATYRLLMKVNNQLRNRVYSLYRQNGIVIEKKQMASKKYRAKIKELNPLPDYWQIQIKVIMEDLEINVVQLLTLKKAIISFGSDLFPEELNLLTTIPGFSPLTAMALMSDIAEIKRFPSAKKMCSYLRTTPSIRSSNRTQHLGAVSKSGRSLTVSLMTQSINHLKIASPTFTAFYTRLREGKSPGKCRIALIRKTLTVAFYMLKRHTVFNCIDPIKYEIKKKRFTAAIRISRENLLVQEANAV